MFGSALLRCELAQDGARGFGSGIGCSGVILMTRDGRRQVGIGQIGVGTVMVVTAVKPKEEGSCLMKSMEMKSHGLSGIGSCLSSP